MSFELAHQRLVECLAVPDRGENPADPATVQAMQIALELPKEAPPRSEVLAAAATAVVAVCLDELAGRDSAWAEGLSNWYGHRIRKVARRARNTAWKRAQALPGVTATNGRARARAFVPSAVNEVDPLIRKLQIRHTDLPMDDPGPPNPGLPVIYVDASLEMSAGKAAAQVGHASMMLAADMSLEEAEQWRDQGFALSVREIPRDTFARLSAGAVVVRDAGFTEVTPGSITVAALRRPQSLR